MILNPKDYIKELEESDLKRILQERDKIIDFMHDFENNRIPEKYYERDPGPETIYLTNIEYLKEICDLIKIKMNEKQPKNVRLSPYLAIEEVTSKFDDEKKKQFFEDLKAKDKELYYKYLEWKMEWK